ncbi:MAG: DMT family transporter [Alphaproteobacteria bacterium]|nr:DMT family transporter [Alphaproteobacteria bacterium]
MTEAAPSPLRGILLLVVSNATFTVMDVLSKHLAENGLPVVEIAWTRYVVQTLVILCVMGPLPAWRAARTARPIAQICRGACVFSSSIFFILALSYLPIATSAATGFVSPLFVTALSIPLLGEVVGWRRWTAVIVGFIGVLVIIRPGFAGFSPASIFPVLSAVSWALALVLTRMMKGEPIETTFFYSAVVGLVLGAAALPFFWQTPDLISLFWLLIMGVSSATSHFLLIKAFQYAEAGLLAPFQYTQLIWAALAGFIIWGELPDGPTYVGSAIIVASGLYVWARERRLARDRALGRTGPS